MTLDKLLKIGMLGLALGGCAHQQVTSPPVRAKQDYSKYPDYKKDIALYNISKILRDRKVCDFATVNEERFVCEIKGGCAKKSNFNYSTPVYNPYSQSSNTINYSSCEEYQQFKNEVRFSEIESIKVSDIPRCIDFLLKESKKSGVCLQDKRQAEELKEAIEVYKNE
ncbi:MAG: hypothetical protein ABIA37_02505 [Candidatus Woesearchaeota archaeon]